MEQAIRVILVSGSLFVRTVVTGGLLGSSDIELVGCLQDVDDIRKSYPEYSPDVIIIDDDMLTKAGSSASEVHSQGRRISIIKLVDKDITGRGEVRTLKDKADKDGFVQRLRAEILRVYSEVPVSPFAQKIAEERSRIAKSQEIPAVSPQVKPEPVKFPFKSVEPEKSLREIVADNYAKVSERTKQITGGGLSEELGSLQIEQKMIIAIGASTGGTEAMIEVLKNFPANSPAVVIVQHMPEDFTRLYAERLNKICKMEVREAKDGDILRRGLALLAPGNLQTRVVENPGGGYRTSVKFGDKVSGHRPSVDVMFTSVAENVKCKTVGVIMTGMGSDGAAGLLQMRKNGAYTIGQNKETCVVYGMPAVANEIGAVSQEVALDKIAETVNAFVLGSKI